MSPGLLARLPGFRTSVALRRATQQLDALKADVRLAREELQAEKTRADLLVRAQQRAMSSKRLKEILELRGEEYRAAAPFPHIVIDDFADPEILHGVVQEFSDMERSGWHQANSDRERKSSTEDERRFRPLTRAFIHYFNSGPFLTFLERLTQIPGLIADPHLRGGGLHEIKPGGALGVHADFNFYTRLKAYRRLNLLVYLNADWQDEWGGHLELWDREGTRCVERIAPVFNRAVLFETSNSSYHGHPHPLQCPEGRSRKSIALYYYSLEYPFEHDLAPHSTLFLDTDAHHEH